MALIRFKNQCDYAFLDWMGNHPNSAHSLDEERFYQFAKSVAVYRSQKWLQYDHFEKSILAHLNYFDPDKIERYWSRLHDLVSFHKVGPVPTSIVTNDERYGTYQAGVKDGKMYEIPISREEFLKGGVKAPKT